MFFFVLFFLYDAVIIFRVISMPEANSSPVFSVSLVGVMHDYEPFPVIIKT